MEQVNLPDIAKPYIENYKVPLVRFFEDEVEVHDSVRFILYHYCVFLLTNDLQQYCSNVRDAHGLKSEGNANERFSYRYHEESVYREIFLRDIKHPWALSNLISRGFYIKSFLGGRQYLNLGHIEQLIERAEETYDYSKLEL